MTANVFYFCLLLSYSYSSWSRVKYLLALRSTGWYQLNLSLMGEESQPISCSTSYLQSAGWLAVFLNYQLNLGDQFLLGRPSKRRELSRAVKWEVRPSITMSLQKQIDLRWNYFLIQHISRVGKPNPFSKVLLPSCSPKVYLFPWGKYLIPIPFNLPSLKIPSYTLSAAQYRPIPSSMPPLCSPTLNTLFYCKTKPKVLPRLKHSSQPKNLSSPTVDTMGLQRGTSSSDCMDKAASLMKVMRNSSKVYMFLGKCWVRASQTSLSLTADLLITSFSSELAN